MTILKHVHHRFTPSGIYLDSILHKMDVTLEVMHFITITTNILADHAWYVLFLNKQKQPLLTQDMVTSLVNITIYSKSEL